MLPLDQVLVVLMIGMSHLGLGLFIGRYLKPAEAVSAASLEGLDVANALSRLQHSLGAAANGQIALQLESLAGLHGQLENASVADMTAWAASLRSFVSQLIDLGRKNQAEILAVTSQIEQELTQLRPKQATNSTGIGNEKWFPRDKIESTPRSQELRKAPRFPYPLVQLIAPMSGESVPDSGSFFEAQFRDISTDGFAFYIPEELTVDRVVARLGTAPDVVAVVARIVHQTELPPGEPARFIAGCQIIKRLNDNRLDH